MKQKIVVMEQGSIAAYRVVENIAIASKNRALGDLHNEDFFELHFDTGVEIPVVKLHPVGLPKDEKFTKSRFSSNAQSTDAFVVSSVAECLQSLIEKAQTYSVEFVCIDIATVSLYETGLMVKMRFQFYVLA